MTGYATMTDPDRIEALLDVVDAGRTLSPERSNALVVLGLATRSGKKVTPTNAGWALLSAKGAAFRQI